MTIRVDTFRNQIAATIDLLRKIAAEADDLHSVAYDRTRAADEIRVTGGERDYALDTNGDPRARDAYRTLVDTMDVSAQHLAIAAHTAIRILRESDHHPGPGRRHRRRITALELAESLAAKIRRQERHHEYDAVRALPQPERDLALQQAQAALEGETLARQQAEAEAAYLRRELGEARSERRVR